jgi:hypothetical protein
MATGWPMKVTYANGDVYSASDVNDTNGTINLLTSTTLSVSAGKNSVINGGFDIWQRATSFSLAASSGLTYVADRYTTQTNASQACTVSRQLTGDTTNLPFIQYCLRYQRNSGQTGVARQYLVNSFETVNTIPFVGRTVTLSYYARKGANYSPTSSILEASLFTGTGTDQNAFVYTGSAQIGATNATLTTTWQRFSLTVAIPTTVTELAPTFSWASVGTAGANDYFEITGVQLELGSVATSFSRAQGTIQGELAACQRYYIKFNDSTNAVLANGNARSTTGTNLLCNLPTSMRARPTSLDFTSLQISDGVTNYAVTSLTSGLGTQSQQYLDAGVASGLTQFRPMYLQQNGSTGYVAFSAEL